MVQRSRFQTIAARLLPRLDRQTTNPSTNTFEELRNWANAGRVLLAGVFAGRCYAQTPSADAWRETELAMSLEHPNVVPIHDAGEVDGRLYLAMRLVAGTDLRQLLRAEGTLEPSRALAICGQVASALDAAHAKALVHRDVKPSNLLLDESEHVYLADFGLTRTPEEQGAQQERVGPLGRLPISPPSRSKASRSTGAQTSTRSAACSTSA
jgi:serine/threonine protein kinase